MNEPWQALIRFGVSVAIVVAAIHLVSRSFGGNIFADIRKALPREFRSRMGLCSFLGFAFIVLFTVEQSLFSHLAVMAQPTPSPHSEGQEQRHVQLLILGLIIALLGNLIIVARIDDQS